MRALPALLAVALPALVLADPPLHKAAAPAAAPAPRCLASGDAFLRARMRGALDLDVNWKDAQVECTGGARPDGRGLRVSLAGPLQSDGRRLRFVFGLANAKPGVDAKQVPANLTLIFEGERRVFATRGDDKCTIDELRQQRTGALGARFTSWRVEARGFCYEPAATLTGDARLLVTSFDFAGRIDIEDEGGIEGRKDAITL